MFDIFWKRKPLSKYPAYLGHTVHQEEYDALKARLDQELKWKDELAEAVRMIHEYLEPFATAGSRNERYHDTAVQLAENAHDLLKAGSVTMKQQAREIEQLTEQLDEGARLNDQLGKERDFFRKGFEDAAVIVKGLETKVTALRQQQIMLTTTTPTNVKPKGKPRTTGAKP